ncbi:cilia- and flagella-associated protein 46 [Vombatus ursinus]|uniref:cilia- and flagella-associated protein 46 n=1 Tax=Vombatus ursinus TaxID=29139 RepID=UPI000FFD191A|nr:cilia- and flagella-associated protein 46 [Vombatus ursinus]
MDLTVKKLLCDAEQRKDVEALQKAYQLIKMASEGRCALDSSESFSLELAILCAEQALQMKLPEITEDCVNLYFKGMPPPSQFRGRAYLCQAQLYAPESLEKLGEFEKSVTQFMKAVLFGSGDPRYYFLVYNASVLYWKMARAFLKPGHRQYLIPSLGQIVDVLEQIDEEDKDWVAELMIELLECYLEAGKMEAAVKFCANAALFIKTNAPHRYQRIFSIMVQHKLMDMTKIEEEMKDSISLSILFNINTLKSQANKKLPLQETTKYLKEAYELLQQYQDQKSIEDEKIPLLLQLARLSLSLKCVEISNACVKDLKAIKQTDPGRMIEVECLEYELEILRIDSKVKAYTRSAVETQLNVIKRLNLALLRASRLKDPNVMQVVCATQWNLCLPLLQHNLRGHLLKPLIQVAEILEKMDSLMTVMRCQVHIEISHIEEDEDRLEVAMEHLQKAMHLDYLGQYREHLKMAYNRLHLRSMLYQVPKRMEDKAIMAIEQAKKAKPKDSVRKKRALLVNVGLALAPDAFQIVLDGENETKVSAGKSRRQISFLCAKARQHTSSMAKADGHLKRLKRDNPEERIYIWADLAKVARKQGVWDVCRTACRFCLLYDVMAKKMSKVRKGGVRKRKAWHELFPDVPSSSEVMLGPRIISVDIQRTFAEVGFINAEAIIHFLQSEGIALNDRPVPPETSVQHHSRNTVVPPEEDAEWLTYSSWIENLSQYAMRNWLRSAEIGQEINEAWLVHNTVVYVLNHNHHLITAGRQRELVDLLQSLLNIMKVTGHNGDTVALVLLCNALARGLILPWIPSHTSDRGRRFLKSAQTHVASLEWNAVSEVKAAIEVCDFGLTLTNGNLPQEIVPIGIRQQLIATWVKAKQLIQQQIGNKLGTDEESLNEGQGQMTKVLVALEMYSCNGLGLMDFNLPSLTQVLRLATECMWTDALMEIQTLVRLTHFAYMLRDHENVMALSKKVLSKGEKFLENQLEVKSSDKNDNVFRAELLSALLCTQGKSIMENLAGRKQLRQQAAKAFLGSIRYAGLAENHTLVMQSARHYWNTCFPFFSSPFCRKKLKQSIQLILKIINKTENKAQEKEKSLILHQWPSMDLQYSGNTDGHFQEGTDDDITLKTALYGLLFHMYTDQNDLLGGLRLLEEAIQVLPRTGHRLLIFKHMVMVKARLGQNFSMEIQKFKDTSEDYLSHMWHCLAFSSKDLLGSLYCYHNAIHALQKPEGTWKKICYLMEFSEWLYHNQFPLNNIIFHLDWAVDLLLGMRAPNGLSEKTGGSPIPTEDAGVAEEADADKTSSNQEGLLQESSEAVPKVTLETLTNVRQLESLAYAHTLLALVLGSRSPQYEENCLMAYRYIMRIWEVSLETVGNVLLNFQESPPEPSVQPTSLRKEKEKSKEKGKEEKKEKSKEEKKEKGKDKDKNKQKEKKLSQELSGIQLIMANKPVETLPASVEEWAFYHCHKDVIALFVQDAGDSTINSKTVLKPNFSLYYLDHLVKALNSLYLIHLTLPILQYAVLISDLIMESKTVSDLYHLRLAQACSELRLSEAAAFHEEIVGGVYINELEQTSCRNEVRSKKEKRSEFLKEVANEENRPMNQSTAAPVVLEAKDKVLEIDEQTGKGLQGISFPYLWMYKAEVLLEMDSYQPAWLLLAEAQVAFRELGDTCAEAKSLYLLAELAKKELKYEQAKKMIEKAQVLGGSEEFWYYSTIALIETLLAQERGRESLIPNIIQKTIDVFLSLVQERPNRKSILKFLATSLEARSAEIQLNIVLDTAGDDDPLDFLYLLEAINCRMVKIEKSFFDDGYKDHCVDVILHSARIKRLFAKYEADEKAKVCYYLEAYNLTQKAIMYLEEIFYNIQSLLPLNETQNISTPLMRKLATVKLKLVEISLEIIQYNQEKVLQEEMKKGTWEKILADYLLNTSDFTKLEWDWFNLKRTVAHRTLAHLESMQHFCTGCTELQAKFLYFTGKTLHLLALQTDPVHLAHYWDENSLLDSRVTVTTSLETDKEETEAESRLKPTFLDTSQNEDQIQKARELKKRFALAQKFRSQASEVLLQCLQISLNNNLISITAQASLEMVESTGVMDQPSACQFLALYQSCSASLAMRKLLFSVTTNTSSSQLAALLQLHQKLQQQGKTGTALFQSVEQKLWQISKAWQNLCVSEQHFNILNDLPPSYRIIILQHSADRSILYGMVYEKPKFGPGPKGKMVQISGQCQVFRARKDPTTISQLLRSMNHFKEELVRSFPDGMSLEARSSATEEDEKLIQMFTNISRSLETYLKPVFAATHHWDIRIQGEGGKKGKEKELKPPPVTQDNSGPPVETAEYLVLIVDRLLLELPLEVAGAFENGNITSVSRELSLQMLANRLHKEEPEVSKKEGKGGKDAKQKSKKFGKKSSRFTPANCIPVETSNFKYIVDPFEEAKASTESITPVFKMREILDKYHDPYTGRWSGFLGSKNFPSQADWEQCLSNCSGFLFYGMENLLSHVLIDSLITMNLQECQMIILLNLTKTVYSTQRRAKFDEILRPSQRLLHKPVDTAILLSLIGVRCVMSNQWPTYLYCNAKRADLLCEDLLRTGKPSGKAVYHLLKTGLAEAGGKEPGRQASEQGSGKHQAAAARVFRGEQSLATVSLFTGHSPRTSREKVSDHSASALANRVVFIPPWTNFNFVLFGLPNLFIV